MQGDAPPEIIAVAGREVAVSNPDKILFPHAGYTKLDLARYYIAVSDGALRGAGGRPNVLVRYPNGIDGEFFFQKRAPRSRPSWIDVVTLPLSVRPQRRRSRPARRGRARLDGQPRLPRAAPAPGARRRSRSSRRAPRRSRSRCRASSGRRSARSPAIVRATLDDVGLVGWPKTSGSRGMHIYVRIERRWTFDEVRRAALALAREVERRAPALATSKWWKEERHGVFLDYNQNAKDRTIATAYSVRPTADARVSAPLAWDEIDACEPGDFTLRTMPSRCRSGSAIATPASIGSPCSLEPLLELSERQQAEGQGDAPWPPHYRKQAGEAPRVAPSTPPYARRIRSSKSAARASKADALAGLDRWKARHPDAARAPRGRRRAGRRDARPLPDVDAGARQPAARARGRSGRQQEALDPDDRIEDDWKGVSARRVAAPKTFSSS